MQLANKGSRDSLEVSPDNLGNIAMSVFTGIYFDITKTLERYALSKD